MNPVNLKCSLEAGRVRCSDIYGIQVGASDIGYATLMRWQTSVLDLQLVTDVNLKGLDSCGRRSSQASHRLHLVGGGRGNKVSAHGKTSSVMKPPEMKICRAPHGPKCLTTAKLDAGARYPKSGAPAGTAPQTCSSEIDR